MLKIERGIRLLKAPNLQTFVRLGARFPAQPYTNDWKKL